MQLSYSEDGLHFDFHIRIPRLPELLRNTRMRIKHLGNAVLNRYQRSPRQSRVGCRLLEHPTRSPVASWHPILLYPLWLQPRVCVAAVVHRSVAVSLALLCACGSIFPLPPLLVVFLIVLGVVLIVLAPPDSWLRTGWLAELVWSFSLWVSASARAIASTVGKAAWGYY